ncbi:hypothetical protein N7535_006777 [Penicillium sp. DV-2018c]|nr:hypothetical protein N7535_006777 [Penicillium sp. DV-2018c]
MPRCKMSLSKRLTQIRREQGLLESWLVRIWAPLGLWRVETPSTLPNRTIVLNWLRALWDPTLREWCSLGGEPVFIFKGRGAAREFQTTLFNHLGHLPAQVLDAEPDRWELVYHINYLLRFLRYVDPTWEQVLANPLPTLTPLLAPGVQVFAVTTPAGFPGKSPAEAGYPNGWPVGSPAKIPALPPVPPAPAPPAVGPIVIESTAINAPLFEAAPPEDDDALADDSAYYADDDSESSADAKAGSKRKRKDCDDGGDAPPSKK